MPLNDEHIRIHPPLAWTSDHGLSGCVLGVGKNTLLMKANPNPSIEHVDSAEITVYLSSEQSFQLRGRWNRTLDPWVLTLDQSATGKLHDLLGQLRKDQHIEICRQEDVEASDRFTGFDQISLLPEALPLVDPAELDTVTNFLGRNFALPLLITGMTGGISKGIEINRRLAKAAEAFQIPMGVGSQRIALENAEYAEIFRVKDHAPGVFLIGNIGMAQLLDQCALDLCQRAVDMIRADALAIHFNLVQEFIQIEGDRRYKGLLQQLERICTKLSVPIMAKEVGCGMTPASARRLSDLGVSAIDIGGRGGTSWARIEGLRSMSPLVQELGDSFRDWGIPTAYSLVAVKRALPTFPVVATGGIRDGHTAAKAVALGAQMAGIGLPLLRAACDSDEAPHRVLEGFERGLKLAMLASGCDNLTDLRTRIRFGRPLEAEFREQFGR